MHLVQIVGHVVGRGERHGGSARGAHVEAHLAPRDAAEVRVLAIVVVVVDLFAVFVPHGQRSAAGPAVRAQTTASHTQLVGELNISA